MYVYAKYLPGLYQNHQTQAANCRTSETRGFCALISRCHALYACFLGTVLSRISDGRSLSFYDKVFSYYLLIDNWYSAVGCLGLNHSCHYWEQVAQSSTWLIWGIEEHIILYRVQKFHIILTFMTVQACEESSSNELLKKNLGKRERPLKRWKDKVNEYWIELNYIVKGVSAKTKCLNKKEKNTKIV